MNQQLMQYSTKWNATSKGGFKIGHQSPKHEIILLILKDKNIFHGVIL